MNSVLQHKNTSAYKTESTVVPFKSQTESNTVRECVKDALETYFTALDGHGGGDLYQLLLNEVEQPMLEIVLKHTRGNQTKAAELLGLNRGTLRKKLKEHGFI
jgi:Fis family transcriptional regulator